MPYLNSGSEYLSRSLSFTSLLMFLCLAGIMPTAPAAAGADGDLFQPWLTVGAGHENDLILDPDFNRTVVPGGSFMNGVAGFSLSHALSPTTAFRLFNRNSLERFFNTSRRTLAASSLRGEFRFRTASVLQARLSAGGDYFNDSGSPSFRRLGGNLEGALGLRNGAWLGEASVFYQGRRYPNVQVALQDPQAGTYTEDQLGGGLLLGWKAGPGFFLWGRLTGKSTSALDPDFDSRAWTSSIDMDLRLDHDLGFSAGYIHQARTFDNRQAGLDTDSYDRIGMGINKLLSRKLRLDARYAHASYSYPQGGDQKTDRVSVALTMLLGKDRPRTPAAYRPLDFGPARDAADPDLILLRIHAPGAGRVAVVGSFNGWDPRALPLRRAEDGWWEISTRIAPGTYEYAYLVDGTTITPPEAVRTTADGFGGRNGILVITGDDR